MLSVVRVLLLLVLVGAVVVNGLYPSEYVYNQDQYNVPCYGAGNLCQTCQSAFPKTYAHGKDSIGYWDYIDGSYYPSGYTLTKNEVNFGFNAFGCLCSIVQSGSTVCYFRNKKCGE